MPCVWSIHCVLYWFWNTGNHVSVSQRDLNFFSDASSQEHLYQAHCWQAGIDNPQCSTIPVNKLKYFTLFFFLNGCFSDLWKRKIKLKTRNTLPKCKKSEWWSRWLILACPLSVFTLPVHRLASITPPWPEASASVARVKTVSITSAQTARPNLRYVIRHLSITALSPSGSVVSARLFEDGSHLVNARAHSADWWMMIMWP